MSNTKNVLEWLDSAAENTPNAMAFSDESQDVSFGELSAITSSIGTALAQQVGSESKPVAVIIDRNVQSVCAFLGVAASGNFYVPIDATLPPARIQAILEQMQPAAVINTCEDIPSGIDWGKTTPIPFGELAACACDLELLASIRKAALDTNPLYAICTSGTTGVPKGVLISHRSVVDFIPIFAETFGLSSRDIIGNQAPFDFDVSVKDIYTALYCGASVHIIPKKCFAMPKLLVSELCERKTTVIIWAVSALSVVAGFKAFKHDAPETIRTVMFSGEVMPVKHLKYWQETLPNATFINLYGPTEITCNCMYYVVDRDFSDDERLPLGIPFDNERIYVLNENNAPICPGEAGEICVAGTCLALGYYRNPERTAQAFVQNPLNDLFPELIYRTGDLARYNERGELVYASRKDFQIKHMGHRIELEELEVHMNAIANVDRACCIFDEPRNKIVACYAGDIQREDIVAALGEKLPKYMIPNVFHQLDALPITKNGKIDRKALKEEYCGS